MPDPKLKAAAAEIKVILEKYDIGALVALASQTHTEFLTHIVPSWSCAWIENGNVLRVKAAAQDFPDKAAHKKCLEDTVGMIAGFADVSRRQNEDLQNVLRLLGERMDISHISRLENPRA